MIPPPPGIIFGGARSADSDAWPAVRALAAPALASPVSPCADCSVVGPGCLAVGRCTLALAATSSWPSARPRWRGGRHVLAGPFGVLVIVPVSAGFEASSRLDLIAARRHPRAAAQSAPSSRRRSSRNSVSSRSAASASSGVTSLLARQRAARALGAKLVGEPVAAPRSRRALRRTAGTETGSDEPRGSPSTADERPTRLSAAAAARRLATCARRVHAGQCHGTWIARGRASRWNVGPRVAARCARTSARSEARLRDPRPDRRAGRSCRWLWPRRVRGLPTIATPGGQHDPQRRASRRATGQRANRQPAPARSTATAATAPDAATDDPPRALRRRAVSPRDEVANDSLEMRARSRQ